MIAQNPLKCEVGNFCINSCTKERLFVKQNPKKTKT